jgi:hypothetical protein
LESLSFSFCASFSSRDILRRCRRFFSAAGLAGFLLSKKIRKIDIVRWRKICLKYSEDKKMYQNKSTTLFTSIMGNHQHLTLQTKRLKENCDHSVWCFA